MRVAAPAAAVVVLVALSACSNTPASAPEGEVSSPVASVPAQPTLTSAASTPSPSPAEAQDEWIELTATGVPCPTQDDISAAVGTPLLRNITDFGATQGVCVFTSAAAGNGLPRVVLTADLLQNTDHWDDPAAYARETLQQAPDFPLVAAPELGADAYVVTMASFGCRVWVTGHGVGLSLTETLNDDSLRDCDVVKAATPAFTG